MASHLHDVLLWDTCQGHVACGGATKIVEMVIRDPSLGERLLPGPTKVPDGLTCPMKHPWSLWVLGEPAPRNDLGKFPCETQGFDHRVGHLVSIMAPTISDSTLHKVEMRKRPRHL